ncbi:MAG: hypothetical protein AAFR17_12650 [Pseudomonadota bacterium]
MFRIFLWLPGMIWVLLPYWIFMALGVLVIATGAFFVSSEVRKEQELGAALAAGPPETVALEAFDATQHIGPAGEVRIVAQLDLTNVERSEPVSDDTVELIWIRAPLYPSDAADREGGPRAIAVKTFTSIAAKGLARRTLRQGEIGPVVEIHGRVHRPSPLAFLVPSSREKAVLAGGSAPPLLIIKPFTLPREVELSYRPFLPGISTARVFISSIALGAILILIGGAKFLFERRDRDELQRLEDSGYGQGVAAVVQPSGLTGHRRFDDGGSGRPVATGPVDPNASAGDLLRDRMRR